jgi:hypothetical protein
VFNPNPKPSITDLLIALAGGFDHLFKHVSLLQTCREKRALYILLNKSEDHCPFCDRRERVITNNHFVGNLLSDGTIVVLGACNECYPKLYIRDKRQQPDLPPGAIARVADGVC